MATFEPKPFSAQWQDFLPDPISFEPHPEENAEQIKVEELNKIDLMKIQNEISQAFSRAAYDKCQTLLERLKSSNQMSAENFFQAGTIAYNQGELNEAENFFKKALEINPQHTDSSISLSVLYNDLGQYEQASEVYHRGLKSAASIRHGYDAHLEDQLAVKHEELGDLYYRFERYAEAAHEYDKAIRQVHVDRKVSLSLKYAKALEKQGVVSRAIEYLDELSRLFPQQSEIKLSLGVIHYHKKDFLKAYEQLHAALRLNPNDEQALLYLSLLEKSTLTYSHGINQS